MRNSYTVNVPPTRDQGSSAFYASASYLETMRQNALDTYNRMRAHDGQEPLSRMPKGTKYIRNKRATFVQTPIKRVKCQDCEWKKVRDYNPDFLADNVARCCFTQVWMMNPEAAVKPRQCICFKKS